MKVLHYSDAPATEVTQPGAKGTQVRIPIGVADGAPTFTMRVFTLSPGGNTPYHRHDYEHEIYIIRGAGILKSPEGQHAVSAGTVVLVKPDEWHGFVADAAQGMEMMCLVPNRVYTGLTKVELPPQQELEEAPSRIC